MLEYGGITPFRAPRLQAGKQLGDVGFSGAVQCTLLRDRIFLTALAAGPITWLVMYAIQQPTIRWDWPLASPFLFLVPALLYPVLEEIAFRGLLQEALREYVSRQSLGPVSVANLLTSVLFAGVHLYHYPPLWAALLFFPSLVFGFFKDRTGALTAPICLHVFYNVGYVWIFALAE